MPDTPNLEPPLSERTITVADKLPQDFKEEERLKAEGWKESGIIERMWAGRIASFGDLISMVLEYGTSLLKGVLAKMTTIISSTEAENAQESGDLAAAFLNGILNSKLDPAELRKLFAAGGAEAAFETIGKAIYEGIIETIVKEEQLSPQNGIAAAHRFLGFLTNWTIKEAVQKFVLDVIGWEWLDKFDGMADEMFQKLALERHSRAALRPLFDITLRTPLEWNLNQKYRPKLLSASESVAAFTRGDMTQAELNDELSRQGYSDERIAKIRANAEGQLSDGDLSLLVHHKLLTREQGIEILRRRGFPELTAELVLKANDLNKADAQIRARAEFWEKQVLDGDISLAEFRNFIFQMPFSDEEKQARFDIVAVQLTVPRKRLSLGQMREAFLHGTINLVEWQAWLNREGYSDADKTILTIELLLDVKGDPRKLSFAQLRAAFLADLITQAEFETRLRDFNYPDSDRALILALALADKAAAASKAAPKN